MLKNYTNIELYNFIMGLSEELMQKVTGKVAYALTYNIRKIQNELKEYLNIRNDIIHRHSKELEDGNIGIAANSKEYDDFINEMKTYDELQHFLDLILIKEEDLCNSSLNAIDMMALSMIVEDGNE